MKLYPMRGLAIPCLLAVTVIAACSRDAGAPAPTFAARPLPLPSAAGSTSPNLAAGTEGTLVLSWLEPWGDGHALRYSELEDAGWSEARLVAAGDDWFVNWADFPSVTPLSEDLWAAHWLVRQPAGGYAYDIQVSLSPDRGATWSPPVRPHDDDTPTEHGFVTLFPRGSGAGLVWLDGRNMLDAPEPDTISNGMTLRAATVTRERTIADAAEIDSLTCDCCQTDAASTARGVVAVYRDRTVNEIRDVHAARLTEGGWQAGRPVGNDGWSIPGCPVNGPVIAAAGDRVAVAWFTGAEDRPRVRIARSVDAGATWSAPLDVARGETAGHPGLALLPDERLAVTWICERPGGEHGVCLRTVSGGDRAGAVHVVSGAGKVPPLSVPQLARHGDLLVVAWTEESGGRSRIASAAIPIATLP